MVDAQDIIAMREHCPTCRCDEQRSIFALLGLCFWDPVCDRQVCDGLFVTAWPERDYSSTTEAFKTPSGKYAFRGLPGLHEFEYRNTRRSEIGSPPRSKRFVVKVIDEQWRFLPFAFYVDLPLPAPAPNLFSLPCFNELYPHSSPSSPPETDSRFYLFSALTRTVSPGVAVVRAQLKIEDKNRPGEYLDAANAVLEVTAGGKKWYGISDYKGSAAVFFPYPALDHASPPYSTEPLYRQKWNISVGVQYSENQNLIEDKETEGRALPDINEILKQPKVNVLLAKNTIVPELAEELQFGRELVLRTKDAMSTFGSKSELYIETITSP
jgi:hypothetical protein